MYRVMPTNSQEAAAATVEACAAWVDEIGRAAADQGDSETQERLNNLAEAMRFDHAALVARAVATMPAEEAPTKLLHEVRLEYLRNL
jgi:hypothetical protein